MTYLLDTSPATMAERITSPYVSGQLLTPLTQYADWGGTYAVDNGAFSHFRPQQFRGLLTRMKGARSRCLFVAIPDIVGNARRTLDIWRDRHAFADGWPMAWVAQDGSEDMDIPWDEMAALFLGGKDPWKDSQAAADLVRCANILGKHTHIGRVNTPRRFVHFAALGADTCDGSGVCKYDHMLRDIEDAMTREPMPTLFDGEIEESEND